MLGLVIEVILSVELEPLSLSANKSGIAGTAKALVTIATGWVRVATFPATSVDLIKTERFKPSPNAS